jgi:hypothetical protein
LTMNKRTMDDAQRKSFPRNLLGYSVVKDRGSSTVGSTRETLSRTPP